MNSREKAGAGLSLLKDAVLEYVAAHPDGVRNVEVAEALSLQSDFEGDQKDYLSWSVLGLLVNEGKTRYQRVGKFRRYFVDGNSPSQV